MKINFRHLFLITVFVFAFTVQLTALEHNTYEYGIAMYENGDFLGFFSITIPTTTNYLDGEWLIFDEYYGAVYFDAPQFDQLMLYSSTAYELQEDGTWELWGGWINPNCPYPNVCPTNYYDYLDYLGLQFYETTDLLTHC